MYRITKMSGQYYARKICTVFDLKEDEDECENIQTFAEEGSPVIIVDEVEAFVDMFEKEGVTVDEDDIIVV